MVKKKKLGNAVAVTVGAIITTGMIVWASRKYLKKDR